MALPARTCGAVCDSPLGSPVRCYFSKDSEICFGARKAGTAARCVADRGVVRYKLQALFSRGASLRCEVNPVLDAEVGRMRSYLDGADDKLPPLFSPELVKGICSENTNAQLPLNGRKGVPLLCKKLHLLEERDEERLSARLLSLSRSNKVRSAVELFMSMDASGLRPNSHACNSLLSCLIRNRSHKDALHVFEIMRQQEMASSHAYSLMIKAVEHVDGAHAALEMFNRLDSGCSGKEAFDIVVYNTVISICARANNWIEAEKIWKKITHSQVSGTLITYELLVSTFVRCHQTELALSVYYEMVENGLEAREDILKAIIACCSREGKWELAVNTFEKMLKCKIKPNIVTFNSVINALGKAGEVELSFKVYSLLEDFELQADAYTWTALLSALYSSALYSDVLKLFQGIKYRDSSILNYYIYNVALMACQRLGLWERALQLLWEMDKEGIHLSTTSYNHVIAACEVAREPKVALQVYRRMVHQKCTPDTFTYLSIIRACVWGSLWTEVEDLLEHIEPDASLYNALVHGFCLRGKIMLAKKLYAKMQSIGIKADGKTRALMLQHFKNTRHD